jgi:hypothetical protein
MNQQFNFNSNRMPLQHHQHPNPFYNNFESLICRICLNPKPKSEVSKICFKFKRFEKVENFFQFVERPTLFDNSTMARYHESRTQI